MQSDSPLAGIHKVVHHDLPNQLVAVRGLLQLLELEESARLSAAGREYLRRLQNAVGRAGDLVRFVKEMERIHELAPVRETIPLAGVSRELQGRLKEQHPEVAFEFEWQWTIPAVGGDARVLGEALQELLGEFLSPAPRRCRVTAQSKAKADSTELTFVLEGVQPSGGDALDQRIGFLLARAWLGRLEIGLEIAQPVGGSIQFGLMVRNR